MIHSLITSNGTKMGVERLQEALIKWEQVHDEQEKRQKEADATKLFWENSGKLGELLRSPNRRLIRESKTYPLSILNSGRFSSHWFVLLTDIFIHVTGTTHTIHPLQTLWVEPLPDSENIQVQIYIYNFVYYIFIMKEMYIMVNIIYLLSLRMLYQLLHQKTISYYILLLLLNVMIGYMLYKIL